MSNIDSQEFQIDLNNFSGSLDLLLDLAKSQKVDLEKISVTKLADQFHEFITKTKNLNLEFLGFMDTLKKVEYAKLFPEDKNNVSLNNWHKFELNNVVEKYKVKINEKTCTLFKN